MNCNRTDAGPQPWKRSRIRMMGIVLPLAIGFPQGMSGICLRCRTERRDPQNVRLRLGRGHAGPGDPDVWGFVASGPAARPALARVALSAVARSESVAS